MLGQSGLETKLLAFQFLLHLRQPADLTNALLRHSRKAFSEKLFHHHFGYISHCLKTVARVLAFDCFVQEFLLIVVYAHALSSFRMSNPVTFPCGCEMLQKFVLCRQDLCCHCADAICEALADATGCGGSLKNLAKIVDNRSHNKSGYSGSVLVSKSIPCSTIRSMHMVVATSFGESLQLRDGRLQPCGFWPQAPMFRCIENNVQQIVVTTCGKEKMNA